MTTSRRDFMRRIGGLSVAASAGFALLPVPGCSSNKKEEGGETSGGAAAKTAPAGGLFFKISLAEWSLHKTLFANEMTNLDFPVRARNEFGISAVEYVNQFFKDKAKDQAYLNELKKICADNGVTSVLVMVDGEGNLGDADETKRKEAVENHYQWVEAAKFLGCHSIRVNAGGSGTREEHARAAADGLRKLSEFAAPMEIGIIVENHGGYSSDGKWLSDVIKSVGLDNCGTLPDFGNFCISRDPNDWRVCLEEYDRYQGMKDLMPLAKGVSAKSYDFDEQGNCIETDYKRVLKKVKDAGYRGHIGIEYEGSNLSEPEGIKATKALLERVGATV